MKDNYQRVIAALIIIHPGFNMNGVKVKNLIIMIYKMKQFHRIGFNLGSEQIIKRIVIRATKLSA